jgi:hypothetical protein
MEPPMRLPGGNAFQYSADLHATSLGPRVGL